MITKPEIAISRCLTKDSVSFKHGDNPLFCKMNNLFRCTSNPSSLANIIRCTPRTFLSFRTDPHPVQGHRKICRSTPFRSQASGVINHIAGVITCGTPLNRAPSSTALSKTENLQEKQLCSALQEHYPWLPVEDSEALHDPSRRENFITRVFVLHHLNNLRDVPLTRHALLAFHSRYKLLLLAHDQPGYRKIGPFVAQVHQWKNLNAFFIAYREKVMAILLHPASKENHTNVMMHMQGYFRPGLTLSKRQALDTAIRDFHAEKVPLAVPLSLFKDYLSEYPVEYLMDQMYLNFYPKNYQ